MLAGLAYDIRFPRRSGQGGKLRTFLRLRGLHGRKQLLRLEISMGWSGSRQHEYRVTCCLYPRSCTGGTVAPGMCYSDLSLYCREGLCGRRVQVQIRRPLIGGYNYQDRLSMLVRLARSCANLITINNVWISALGNSRCAAEYCPQALKKDSGDTCQWRRSHCPD